MLRRRPSLSCTVRRLLHDFVTLARLAVTSRAHLAAENLFLRKQLALYQERRTKPRRPDPSTRVFWVSHVGLVEKFVKANLNDLVKVNAATHAVAGVGREAGAQPASRATAVMWDPTRGGMRMPHLHYAGEMYLLNESQWAAFSKGAMAALTEKLGSAGRVSFENVMAVSDVIAGM